MAALLRAPHPSPLPRARLHASRSPILNSPLLHSISSSTPTRKISTSRRTLLVPLHASINPLPPSSSNGGSMDVRNVIVRFGEILSLGFPLWVALACFLRLCKPSSFLWVHRDWQILGITLAMLGMGMTLTLDDLKGALLMPKEIAAGFILQYTVPSVL